MRTYFFSFLLLSANLLSAQTQVYDLRLKLNSSLVSFAQDKDTNKLLQFYSSVLDEYDICLLRNTKFDDGQSFQLAVLTRDDTLAAKFLEYKIRAGLSIEEIKFDRQKALFKEFYKTPIAQSVIDNYAILRREYESYLLYPYVRLMSYAFGTDQLVRNIFLDPSGNPFMSSDEYSSQFDFVDDSIKEQITNKLMKITDSVNFINLFLTSVEQYGFPTDCKVGRNEIEHFIRHFYGPGRDKHTPSGISSTTYLDSMLYAEAIAGQYSSRSYAFWHDVPGFPYIDDDHCSTYGTAIYDRKNKRYIPNKIFDIENVDKRRAEIFLPPLWVDAAIYGFELPEGYVKPKE